MDEIKQMLVGIQNSQEELKQGLENLQAVDKKLHKEIREVNSRLAAFQIEMSQKVQTLFDADLTRKENMEDYDERLQNISSELFNHSVRINNLEQKVVGS